MLHCITKGDVHISAFVQSAACFVLQVQNHAGALPTDGSSAAVSISTYTYLQVQCPVAVTERASTADAVGEQGG